MYIVCVHCTCVCINLCHETISALMYQYRFQLYAQDWCVTFVFSCMILIDEYRRLNAGIQVHSRILIGITKTEELLNRPCQN